MNIQEFIKDFKGLDKKIVKIMRIGISFSFILCIIASVVLLAYSANSNPSSFYIGMSLFRTGLFFIVGFIICGLAFNKIINDI